MGVESVKSRDSLDETLEKMYSFDPVVKNGHRVFNCELI